MTWRPWRSGRRRRRVRKRERRSRAGWRPRPGQQDGKSGTWTCGTSGEKRSRGREPRHTGPAEVPPSSGGELAADVGERALLVLVEGRERPAHARGVVREEALHQLRTGRRQLDDEQ